MKRRLIIFGVATVAIVVMLWLLVRQYPSPTAPDVAAQTKALAKENETRLQHGDLAAALAVAKQAYALTPNAESRTRISETLGKQLTAALSARNAYSLRTTEDQVHRMTDPALLDCANNIVQLRQADIDELPPGTHAESTAPYHQLADHAMAELLRESRQDDLPTLPEDAMKGFRQRYRRFALALTDTWVATIAAHRAPLDSFQSECVFGRFAEGLSNAADTGDVFTDGWLERVAALLKVVRDADGEPSLRDVEATRYFLGTLGFGPGVYWQFSPRAVRNAMPPAAGARVDACLADIQKTSHPLLALVALEYRLTLRVAPEYADAQAANRYADAVTLAASALDATSDRDVGNAVYAELLAVRFAAQLPPDVCVQARSDLLTMMYKRREIARACLAAEIQQERISQPEMADAHLRGLIALAKRENVRFFRGSAQELRQMLQEMEDKLHPTVAAIPIKELYKADSDAPVREMRGFVVGDGHGYAVGLGGANNTVLNVLDIDLASGEHRGLTPVPLTVPAEPFHFVNDVALGPGLVCVATGSGVGVVPTDGSASWSLGTDDGLPQKVVRSVAVVDGTLFIGYGVYSGMGMGGYLMACDLATRRLSIIASSRRKEKQTPFDDSTYPFDVRLMVPDAAGHRLLLYVDSQASHLGNDPLTGLWSYQPVEKKFTLLLQCDHSFNPHWRSQVQPDGSFLFGDPGRVARFDSRTNKATAVYNVFGEKTFNSGLPTASLFNGPYDFHLPVAMRGGNLWSASPLMYVTSSGKAVHVGDVEFANQTPFSALTALPEGRGLVMARINGVWLMTIPE